MAAQPTPTISRVLSDGTLVELIHDPEARTTALVVGRSDGSVATLERLELPDGELLVPYAPDIDMYRYSLPDIQRRFSRAGARTRHQIAEAVVRELDVLSPRLPNPRKPWQSEPRRLAIFSAAAIALTFLNSDGSL